MIRDCEYRFGKTEVESDHFQFYSNHELIYYCCSFRLVVVSGMLSMQSIRC